MSEILGGVTAKDSMILMITETHNVDEGNIQGCEEAAQAIELGGSLRWESVNISPEEM
jgi:hypothetical protein